MNRPTVYFAINEDGNECSSNDKFEDCASWFDPEYQEKIVYLPKGTIKKLTGKGLTWEDGPLEWNGTKQQ